MKKLKLRHIGGNNSFLIRKYLVDYNSNESLSTETIKTKSISREEIFNFLNKYEKIENLCDGCCSNSKSNLIVSYYSDHKEMVYQIILYYTSSYNIEGLLEYLKEIEFKEVKDLRPKLHMIQIDRDGPTIIVKHLSKEINIDFENAYNLNCKLDDIFNDIKSDKSGLLLFTGEPGSGKTSLIKYMTQNSDKKFFFLSNNNLGILTDPQFLSFCFDEMENAVLILEDCEAALLDRKVNQGYDISNILNLTDGIMGDAMNLKIIATLNTDSKIDSALLRKGRLIRKVEFSNLSVSQGNRLAEKLGKNIKITKEISLCEIYNIEENNGEVIKKLIGFRA